MGWRGSTEKNCRYCFNPVSGKFLIPCCEHDRGTLVFFLSFVLGANPWIAGLKVCVVMMMTLLFRLYLTQTTGHTDTVPDLSCRSG